MPDPKNITESTTLAELREQRLLLGIVALHLYPPLDNNDNTITASVRHATGYYVGTGPTDATAIEAAFVKLRHALLPDELKQMLSP